MKTYEEKVAPLLLTSPLDGDEWSASRPSRFTPGERGPGTHFMRFDGPQRREKFLALSGIESHPSSP
jgi:hypothetical protein